ncbi:hypothetical protein Lser_V15G20349 [Lactuca serriola]
MAEMPLGKLSKSNIQKGFEVLIELHNLLKKAADNPLKESLIVDAINRFFYSRSFCSSKCNQG